VRVVLNACVPARFAGWLPGHEVTTVGRLLGSSDFDDGQLLKALRGRCDAFVTVDKNIPRQQRVTELPFGVVILRARSNRLEHLTPLAGATLAVLEGLSPGDVRAVGV
jgi:predicted nuclease of predicted toxin-antitoxin system